MLTIMTFRTPDEAIEKANNTLYGLSAGIWTDKGSKISDGARAPGRRRLGEHFNKFDPELPSVATRRAASAAKAGTAAASTRPTSKAE